MIRELTLCLILFLSGILTLSCATVPKKSSYIETVETITTDNLPEGQQSPSEQYNLGKMYYESQNYTEAFKWYRKAAEQGQATAQHNLSLMYIYGDGAQKDYAEAFKWSKKAADQGDADAQTELGRMYYLGRGVDPNSAEAVKWWEKAAEQGNDMALDLLAGWYYSGGIGIQQNHAEAFKWYKKAAEKGDADAQSQLADMYYKGEGVQQNYSEAFEWYKKAAEHGVDWAQYHLADMYYKGEGLPQNYAEAMKWYKKAAEQGFSLAQYDLALIYYNGKGVPQNFTEAINWYKKAAEQGHVVAQSQLADMYYKGEGLPQNYAEAMKWYKKAAEQDSFLAAIALGELLELTTYKYEGWGHITCGKNESLFINKKKIRRDGDLVWFWLMEVPFKSNGENQKGYVSGNCATGMMSGYIRLSYFNSKGEYLFSDSESEIKMTPVLPNSAGEEILDYACFLAKALPQTKKSHEKIEVSFGTGWVAWPGFVVTNNHVVEGHSSITIIRKDGLKTSASVAMRDETNDIALLQVADVDFLPLALDVSSKSVKAGTKVFTIGYPHPNILGVNPKYTEGVVNSTYGLGNDPRIFQISVSLQAGNSGGPLMTMNGDVVGLVTAKLNAVKMFKWTGDLPQNVNYAIKAPYIKALLSSATQQPKIKRAQTSKDSTIEELVEKLKGSILIVKAE